MHGLHKMCYFERKKKHSCSIFNVFVHGYLSATMFIFFLADFLTLGKALANFFASKCSVLDVAGVLNPLQYTPTWIAYTNNLIQVPGKR